MQCVYIQGNTREGEENEQKVYGKIMFRYRSVECEKLI